ncbi:MAG: hypothetical protein ACFCGT_12140 [Sandaracinaceae bacterium]
MRGLSGALLLSGAAHVAVAWVLLQMPAGAGLDLGIRPVAEVSIVLVDDPSTRDLEPIEPARSVALPEPLPLPPPAEVEAEQEPELAPPTGATVAIDPSLVDPSLAPPTEESAEDARDRPDQPHAGRETLVDPDAERRRRAAMLDPRNVALSSAIVDFGDGPSRRGPAATYRRDTGPSAEEIGRAHAQSLRTQAMAKTHTGTTRPQLRRRSDGSYAYAGHAFEAVIAPDGHVEFDDRPALDNGGGISTTFAGDITNMFMEAAGQDPHAAERLWFMRHTEELRARLEREHRRREMATAVRRLRGRLSRIWATESRSYRARRARLFQIWDDMAEDGSARSARAAVIRFIQENLPAGDEQAYPEPELERLNAGRTSRERFDPY